MADFANAPSRIVIRTSRETIVLCVAACAMTFALGYAVHSKHGPGETPRAVTQDWTGHLADVAPVVAASSERITSASLVLPKEQLALPKIDMRPLANLRFCDGESCRAKPLAPLPPARQDAGPREPVKVAYHEEQESRPGLLSRLNPLNQVPAVIRKPFAYAGDTVSGWIKRF